MSEEGDDILEAMREALIWTQGKSKARVSRFCPACGARIEEVVSRDELEPAVCPDCGWREETEVDND